MKAIASELAYDGRSGRQRQIWVALGPRLFHAEPWVVGAGVCMCAAILRGTHVRSCIRVGAV